MGFFLVFPDYSKKMYRFNVLVSSERDIMSSRVQHEYSNETYKLKVHLTT